LYPGQKAILNILPESFVSTRIGEGFFLAFRGCSWLWAFLLGTAATENTILSLALLFVFWLSNLPGLYGSQRFLSWLGKSNPRQKAVALFLLATMQLSLWMHWVKVPQWGLESGFQSPWVRQGRDSKLNVLEMICH